jgi:hypothetical protein
MLVSLEIEKNSDDFNIDKSKSLNKHQTSKVLKGLVMKRARRDLNPRPDA